MNHSAITDPHLRTDQINYSKGADARNRAEKGGYRPIGHEAFLKHLEGSGVPIYVKLMDGTEVSGPIKAADRTTISIKEVINGSAYRTRVLFKHAIAEFQPMITLAKKTAEVH